MRTQCVQDHQQRRTRHGGGSDQRRREACNCERHGKQIVARSQPQVLSHQPQCLPREAYCRDDGREAIAEEHQIGGRLAQMGGADR